MLADKSVEARIFGVTSQNSDLRTTIAGNSSGGTSTPGPNPLRGTLCWDRAMFVLHKLAVAGGATGGSYTITLETDAVKGYTGLHIARAAVGPNSASTVVMDNLHQSAGSPTPTHIFIDQTAAGGAVTFDLFAIAKQYRGFMGSPASGTAERCIQGTMLATSTIPTDVTIPMGLTVTNLGMGRMRLWDNAFYWIRGLTVTGTWDLDVVSTVGGTTFSIASTGSGGALSTGGTLAVASNFYGASPNPTALIVTEVSAGTLTGGDVVVLAKSGRGSLAKS
jgi:hypothetical protein